MKIEREHAGQRLVLGVSLGSSHRDHEVRMEILGQPIRVLRKGTDGSFGRLIGLLREYDGRVDAFGLGGAEFSVTCGRMRDGSDRRYEFRQGRRVLQSVRHTPIADGNGVKHILERRAVDAVAAAGVRLRGARALCVSAVDRMGLARALVEQGCQTVFGDAIFSLGLPLPLRSLEALNRLGRVLLPVVTQLPYSLLYPTGEKQDEEPPARYRRYLEEAEILAGDFNWMRQNLPARLDGKVVITNTTTAEDLRMLQARGLRMLVTGTPRLEGRSFGTNVMEAMLLALLGRPQDQVRESDFQQLIDRVPLRPDVVQFSA